MRRRMEDWAVGAYRGHIHAERGRDGRKTGFIGVVLHPCGLVHVRSYQTGDGWQCVYYDTVVDGRHHAMSEYRSPRERVTERGVKTIACRWLRSLVEPRRAADRGGRCTTEHINDAALALGLSLVRLWATRRRVDADALREVVPVSAEEWEREAAWLEAVIAAVEERERMRDEADIETARCTCEWMHPVTGEIDARWPAVLDAACAVHTPERDDAAPPAEPQRLDLMEHLRKFFARRSVQERVAEIIADAIADTHPSEDALAAGRAAAERVLAIVGEARTVADAELTGAPPRDAAGEGDAT